jgi:hypothetical protein
MQLQLEVGRPCCRLGQRTLLGAPIPTQLSLPRRLPPARHGTTLTPRAEQTLSRDGGSQPESQPAAVGMLRKLFTPFSDPSCNSRLIALAVGQMLCSIATLIHDSYLPVYVQDELKLSNTNVSVSFQD